MKKQSFSVSSLYPHSPAMAPGELPMGKTAILAPRLFGLLGSKEPHAALKAANRCNISKPANQCLHGAAIGARFLFWFLAVSCALTLSPGNSAFAGLNNLASIGETAVQTRIVPDDQPLGGAFFYGKFYGTGIITVTLAGVTNSVVSTNYLVETNTGPKEAKLKLYEKGTLTVSGAQLASGTLFVSPKMSLTLLSPAGRKANVVSYKIAVDGQEQYEIAFANTNGLAPFSQNWSIEMRPDNGPRPPSQYNALSWSRAEENLPQDAAPGDSDWAQIGPGLSTNPALASIKWAVNMGRLNLGRQAGKIRLRENGISTRSFTPLALLFTPTTTNLDELVVNTNAGGGLLQVKAPQALADIVTNSPWRCEIRFYTPDKIDYQDGNGIFHLLVGANAFVTNTIESPNQSTNWLRITELRNNSSYVSDIRYLAASNAWFLTNGASMDLKIESRTIAIGAASNRSETVQIRDYDNHLRSSAIEQYQQFAWGWELTNKTVNPGTNQLATFYHFNTDTNSIADYGRLHYITNSDGSWERHEYCPFIDPQTGGVTEYPGALSRVYRPWQDSPATPGEATVENSRYTDYSYGRHISVYVDEAENSFGWNTHHDRPEYLDTESFFEELVLDASYQFVRHEEHFIGAVRDTCPYRIHSYQYAEEAGPDLVDMPYAQIAQNGVQTSYGYEKGTYDPNSRSFTPSENGADWRITEVLGMCNVNDGAMHIDGLAVYTVDRSEVNYFDVYPKQSTKTIRILQKGKLRLEETWVISEFDPQTETSVSERLQALVYSHDSLGHLTNLVRIDGATGLTNRTLYQAVWKGADGADGNLKQCEIDENGVETKYVYDSLKRIKQNIKTGITASDGFPSQVARTNLYTYDSAGNLLSDTFTDGTASLVTAYTNDLAGRILSQSGPGGYVTSFSYSANGRVKTVTYPNNSQKITENYADGRVKSVSGSAVVAEYYGYDAVRNNLTHGSMEEIGYPNSCTIVTNGAPTSTRWRKESLDLARRPCQTQAPGCFVATTNYYYYGSSGLLAHYAEPSTNNATALNKDSGVFFTKYDYWNLNDLNCSSIIMGVTNNVTLALTSLEYGPDSNVRIAATDVYYEKGANSYWHKCTTNQTYRIDNDATPTVVYRTREQLSGLATNVKSVTIEIDADGNATTNTVSINLQKKRTTEAIQAAQSTLTASRVTVNGLLQSERTLTVSQPSRYYYDGLGRLTQAVDPLGFSSSIAYNATTGFIDSTNNVAQKTTRFEYYPNGVPGAGLVKCKIEPNAKKTYYGYTARDDLQHVWGDIPYPAEYKYSAYGELTNLVTFRGGSGWSGNSWPTNTTGTGDVTAWTYQESSGLLLSKIDAQGHTYTYTYYTNNFLKTITDARNATKTFNYNDFGDLAGVEYSYGTNVVLETFDDFDRAGLPRLISDASGDHVLSYDHANRLTNDTCNSGWLNGVTVTNRYHPVYGRDQLRVQTPSTTFQQTYGFDSYGRLNSAAQGVYNAQYSYLPNSDQIQVTDCRSNTTSRLATVRNWDLGYRLAVLTNQSGASTLSRYACIYDDMDRRTRITWADNSAWAYEYNDRDEVVSGKRYWADFAPVAGQQFEYAYDSIGNRVSSKAGGDSSGVGLRPATYNANSLNQYSSRTVPGAADVIGAGYATATVTVNGAATERKYEYFRKEVAVNNSGGVGSQAVTVVATSSSGTNTAPTANLLLPPYQSALTYDLAGNLIGDGLWTYTWDAANRLASMEMVAGAPSGLRRRLEFAYDSQGRRVKKVVKDGTGAVLYTRKFVYDGWIQVAELDGNNALLRSYLWGLDLSGTTEGAGGIGGLLMIACNSSPATNCFVAYDGHGNVAALLDADVGPAPQYLAQYEYGPFGELLWATAPLGRTNPFRFSTKYWDEESGLVYYGARYYSPAFGRWINLDPIEEHGGLNLYCLCQNNPINTIDILGRSTGTLADLQSSTSSGEAMEGGGTAQALSFLNRVREAVNAYNTAQEYGAALMDSDLDNSDDVLMATLMIGADLLTRNLTKSSVIGHVDDLKEFKVSGNFNWFRGWKEGDKFAENMKRNVEWLKDIVKSGEKVVIASSKVRPGSITQAEIKFLKRHGYVRIGSTMVKK